MATQGAAREKAAHRRGASLWRSASNYETLGRVPNRYSKLLDLAWVTIDKSVCIMHAATCHIQLYHANFRVVVNFKPYLSLSSSSFLEVVASLGLAVSLCTVSLVLPKIVLVDQGIVLFRLT